MIFNKVYFDLKSSNIFEDSRQVKRIQNSNSNSPLKGIIQPGSTSLYSFCPTKKLEKPKCSPKNLKRNLTPSRRKSKNTVKTLEKSWSFLPKLQLKTQSPDKSKIPFITQALENTYKALYASKNVNTICLSPKSTEVFMKKTNI